MDNVLATSPLEGGSRVMLWTGRALTALIVSFLSIDAIGKLVPLAPVIEGTQRLGFDVSVISEIEEEDEDTENLALPYIPPQEAQGLGSLASSDMVFSVFGASQGDIHGFSFMDRAINDFKGLTISADECDNRLPLIPLIDN